jgi:hypothetical protein
MTLCLLLAALSLYNPFLAGTNATAGLGICHAASHRATVGASELQNFTPTTGRDILVAPVLATLERLLQLVPLVAQPRVDAIENVPSVLQLLPASMWFRPPPGA